MRTLRLESLLFGTFLGLVFLLPALWGSNRNVVWLLESALVCAILSVAALGLPASRWKATWSRYRGPLLLLAAWLALNLLQLIPWPGLGAISRDIFQSALSTVQSVFYAGLFLLTVLLCHNPRRLRWLCMTMVLAGLGQALFGSLMTLSGREWLLLEPKIYGIGYATGTFVNRNHYAGFLLTCIALGVGLLVGQSGRSAMAETFKLRLRELLRWVMGPAMRLRLMLVLMVIGLVLSHSRMGNGAFFLSLCGTSLLALVMIRPMPRKVLVLLSTLVVVDLLLVGSWFGFEQVVQRLQGTGQYDQVARVSADADRLNISAETFSAAKDFFWLGSGGGTFEQIFPAYRPVNLRKTFDHAHNDVLEFLLEYGLLGLLLITAWAAGGMWAALKAMARRRHPLMQGLGFGVVMALAAGALQALVDFNLRIPACAGYLTIVVALGSCALRAPARSGKSV